MRFYDAPPGLRAGLRQSGMVFLLLRNPALLPQRARRASETWPGYCHSSRVAGLEHEGLNSWSLSSRLSGVVITDAGPKQACFRSRGSSGADPSRSYLAAEGNAAKFTDLS